MLLKTTAILAFGLFLASCDRSEEAQAFREGQSIDYYVSRIVDGDTLVADSNGIEDRIRLCGIDAPESDQPLADEAENLLRELLQDEFVLLTPVERDQYDRIVAEVFLAAPEGAPEGTPERFAQEELLIAGLAWIYPQYIDGCPNAEPMRRAEAIARERQVGVWADPASIPPWEWRQN